MQLTGDSVVHMHVNLICGYCVSMYEVNEVCRSKCRGIIL